MINRKNAAGKQKKIIKGQAEPLTGVLLLSPYLIGLYYPWASALVSLILLWLLWGKRRDGLYVSGSPLLLASGSLVLSLLLGAAWGTDRGMALFGTVKFLPLPLYVLLLEQHEPEEHGLYLRHLPETAALMVLLSFLFNQIPALSRAFLVNGRLSGFFQYPNSFAAWMLAALILCLNGVRGKNLSGCRREAATGLVLISGIVLSGSRAVFLLMLAVLLRHILLLRGRKMKFLGLGALLALCACIAAASLLCRDGSKDRLLAISPYSSAFLGRLLYARDAIPVILRHPLGLGYGGYQALQGSFQTGVYSVLHVHNDFLQLMLDAGWVPALLFLWALVRAFREKDAFAGRKEMLLFLCLHALFDFDMQFVSLTLLLMICMAVDEPKRKTVSGRIAVPVVVVLAGAVSLWIGAASYQFWIGNAADATKLVPFYTTALVQQLASEGDTETMEALADRVLILNDSQVLAHDAKAAAAFSKEDYDLAMAEKEKALRLSRYNREEYLDYLGLLREVYDAYRQNGDQAAAADCAERIRALPGRMEAVLDGTSALGRRIQDQPDLSLTEDLYRQIEEYNFS